MQKREQSAAMRAAEPAFPLRERLEELAEPGYREFASSLVPNPSLPFLGVRLPALRKLAREAAKREDWPGLLRTAPEDCFEMVMLKGMVLGQVRLPWEELSGWIAWFVPKIDNWSVCDSFCTGLVAVRKSRAAVWEWLQPYLGAEQEFSARFGAVMLLDHFLCPEWIGRVIPSLCAVRQPGYYARMAVAWALSICYVKFPEETRPWLGPESLELETLRKTLQKILESRRLTDAQREEIRRLRAQLPRQEAAR